jgi:hypothetical protein
MTKKNKTETPEVFAPKTGILKLSGPSSKPDVNLIHAYIAGNPTARAIVEAWRFKASRATIIRTATSRELEAMRDRQDEVTF